MGIRMTSNREFVPWVRTMNAAKGNHNTPMALSTICLRPRPQLLLVAHNSRSILNFKAISSFPATIYCSSRPLKGKAGVRAYKGQPLASRDQLHEIRASKDVLFLIYRDHYILPWIAHRYGSCLIDICVVSWFLGGYEVLMRIWASTELQYCSLKRDNNHFGSLCRVKNKPCDLDMSFHGSMLSRILLMSTLEYHEFIDQLSPMLVCTAELSARQSGEMQNPWNGCGNDFLRNSWVRGVCVSRNQNSPCPMRTVPLL